MSQYIQTPQQPGVPPQMLPPVQKKSSCLKLVLIAVGVLVVIGIIGILVGDRGGSTGTPVDPAVTLDQAESNIISAGDGVAYSNSEAGHALATDFTKLLKEAAMEGTDALAERHEFITHCQLNDDSVLFLVHVPRLKKFDKESKERFCEIGWMIAHKVLAEGNIKPGVKLAVGVKGLILYQNIYFGKFEAANLVAEDLGVTSKTKETDGLKKFFNSTSAQ